MARRKTERGVSQEELHKFLAKGRDSEVLRQRLAYSEAEAFARYLRPLLGQERCYPRFLPTQANGRWSVQEPPLITFPDDAKAEKRGLPKLRRVVIPNPGHYWLQSDWDAMWARFVAASSNDKEDLRAFREKLDLHTITACRALHFPLPPDLRDPHHSQVSAEWRTVTGWQGKGDRRRRLAKAVRYSLYNGIDERAVLEAKDVEEQGFTFDELLSFARLYLRSKVEYTSWKADYIARALKAGEARTHYGRRLKLFGDVETRSKLAISHYLMGTEADTLDRTLIQLAAASPEMTLVFPSHDGIKQDFAEAEVPLEEALARSRPIVEHEITMNGNAILLTATWEVVRADGSREVVE